MSREFRLILPWGKGRGEGVRTLAIAFAIAALLSISLAASVLAQEATGSVSGTVTNGTADAGAVADQEITLTAYSGQTEKGEKTARTDKDGKYSFEDLEIGPAIIYQLSTEHQGVPYYSQPFTLPAEGDTDMKVFDSTTAGDVLSSLAKHYLLEADRDGVFVSEIVIIKNSSDKTYAGSKEAHPGINETLRFVLPAGAEEVQYVDGFVTSRVIPAEDGFVDTLPIYPGDSQRIYRYRLPATSDSVSFASKLILATDKVSVLVPDTGLQISVSNLPNKSNPEIQGEKYLLFSGEKLAADTALEFKLTGLSKVAPPASASAAGAAAAAPASNSTMPMIAGGVVGLVSVGAVLAVVLRRRRSSWETPEDEYTEGETASVEPEDEAEDDELELERQDLVAAIASLDDAYEQGRIGAEEYGMLREQQKRRLLEVVAQQQGVAARDEQ